MNIEFVAPKCKLLNVEQKTNKDGSLTWYEIIILQGANSNSMTCEKKTAESLKVGSVYDLIISVSEQPKAYRNGNGAYIENKFKCTGILNS